MTPSEIKKELYKQKPIASKISLVDQKKLPEVLRGMDIYQTIITLNGTGHIIEFRIPWEDQPEGGLNSEEPAQLLIRWLHIKKES